MKKILSYFVMVILIGGFSGMIYAANEFQLEPNPPNTQIAQTPSVELPAPANEAASTDITGISAENNDALDRVDNTPTSTISDTTQNNSPPDEHTTSTNANASNVFGSTDQGRVAFTNMIRNLMPLSPQQIHTLRDLFDQTQQAVAQSPGVPPRPTSSSILVNMSPGAAPPVIRLRAGYVTSLVFLDSTGQPWPVVGYDIGDPKAFNIVPSAPDGKSNTMIVQASYEYKAGNLAVMLKDENTPVMLTLMPGQRAVDYRVDLRIPGLGPNAVVSMNGLPATENPQLLNFLDGIAPDGARLLHIEGAPAQVWLYHNHLFLRTRVTILSPGWISTMSSPDGTHVFELEKTPVILASERGEMVQLIVKGL